MCFMHILNKAIEALCAQIDMALLWQEVTVAAIFIQAKSGVSPVPFVCLPVL